MTRRELSMNEPKHPSEQYSQTTPGTFGLGVRMATSPLITPPFSSDAKPARFVSTDTKQVPAMTAIPQTKVLTKDQCATGLKAAVNILEKWHATTDQACNILRISRSTHARAKLRDAAWSVSLDSDQMQRVSFVLNIHAALRMVFDNPENVYGFPTMANHNGFFNGRSPLEVMAQGDMISLYESFRRIDSLRGAQW